MSIQFIIFLIVVLFQGAYFVWGLARNSARRRSMNRLAQELGLEVREASSELNEQIFSMDSLDNGSNGVCSEVVYGDSGARQLSIFDMIFESGDNGRKKITTSICWQEIGLDIPPFMIQPKGYQAYYSRSGPELSLENHYEIKNRFVMNCPSEKFANAFFDTEVVDVLLNNKDVVCEYFEGTFSLQLKRKMMTTSRIKELMSVSLRLFDKVAKHSGSFVKWKEELEEEN